MKKESFSKRVFLNTAIQAVGKVLYLACSFAIAIMLTRYLGREKFGMYNTTIAFWALVGVFGDLGIFLASIREAAKVKNEEEKSQILGSALTLRIITALLFILVGLIIAQFLPYPALVKKAILIFAIGEFFILLNQIFLGVGQLYLSMTPYVVSELLGRFLSVGIIFWLTRTGGGLLEIILAPVLGLALFFILVFIWSNLVFVKVVPRADWALIKNLLLKSLPLGILLIVWTIFFKIDSFMLSVLPLKKVVLTNLAHFSNMEAVGIYGVSYKVLEIVLIFPGLLTGLVFPAMSRFLVSDFEKAKSLFDKTFLALLAVALPTIIFIFFFAKSAVLILGGKEFLYSVLPLQILAFSFVPFFVGRLANDTLIAGHKQRDLLTGSVFFVLFNIVLNFVFIPYLSYVGAAVATVLSQLAFCLFLFVMTKKKVNLAPSWQGTGKVFLAALVSLIFAFVFSAIKIGFFDNILDEVVKLTIGAVGTFGLFGIVLILLGGVKDFYSVFKKE